MAMTRILLLCTLFFLALQHCPQVSDMTMAQPQPPLDHTLITPEDHLLCIQSLLDYGMLQSASSLLQASNISADKMREFYQYQITRLTALSRSLVSGSSSLEPILKWGQSKDSIYLTFKLSHRWDTPPCNQPTQEEYFVRDNNSFLYHSKCIVSRQDLNFILSLELFGNVVPSSLTVKKHGVGTYILSLVKETPGIWASLESNGQKRQIWPQMITKYPDIMGEFLEQSQSSSRPQSVFEALTSDCVWVFVVMAVLL